MYLLLLLFALPFAQDQKSEEWMKNSVEFKANCYQVYSQASKMLDSTLKDRLWSAELSQIGNEMVWDKKLAIILDLDETVIDNIGYYDFLREQDTNHTSEMWDKWVSKAEATAIVGAVEFIKKAESKGIEIFYITNRACKQRDSVKCPQQEETLENLKKIGLKSDDYHLLLKDEYKSWTSDKGIRRQMLTEQYRILMLIGDDFNDFYDNAVNLEQAKKEDALYKKMKYFGERWFIIPNPNYGTWQNYKK